MGMLGYDRILIEPSGIFDVDEFFDVLYEEPLSNWYEIGNVIAIVDAKLDNDLSKESDFLLASQIANAGCVLLSRVENASKEDFNQILSCGYEVENYTKLAFQQDQVFTSLYFMNVKMTKEKLYDTIKQLMNDTSCGKIFRIKGFMQLSENEWIELNATHNGIIMKPIQIGQEIIIVIGEELVAENIKNYWKK